MPTLETGSSGRGVTPRDRVLTAIRHGKPDRTPRDFAAAPEIWARLQERLGLGSRADVLDRLGVDCRVVSYDSFCHDPAVPAERVDPNASQERSSTGGMWRRVERDGSNRDIWGAHRSRVANAFGALDQYASYPLGGAATLDDLQGYRWPAPDWWDFRELRSTVEAVGEGGRLSVRYRVGSVFETAWSLFGFERFLLDLGRQPALPLYAMERICDVHVENLRRVLVLASDLIDVVYFYDDLATQSGLLVSPRMYDRFIRPFHQRLIDLAARHRKPTMMHCCGSVYPLIPKLLEMGLTILNPVQPTARDMRPQKLADEFGGRLCFHGGIDIHEFLPSASPAEVREEVARVSEILGAEGGYILAGSHHIQADTPIENVLAMYGQN